ncbi:PAS domain S-box protein [Pollutibacter soli]|uniref:PAS domain S-box protein n=1 Tax=Pollutibacter soli TaxID=3034157 RepID=UPI0030136B57
MPVAEQLLYQQNLKRWSRYLIGTIILICAIVLSGWLLDFPVKFSPELMILPMNPLSAICFLLAAVSLTLCSREVKTRLCFITINTTAFFVLIIGLLRLSDTVFEDSFNVDALLLKDHPAIEKLPNSRGRMTPNTALNFVLAGFALLLFDPRRKKLAMLYSYTAIIIGLMTLFFLVAYFYNIRQINANLSFLPMSLSTALCFILLAIALLFAQPDNALIRTFSSRTPGGSFARMIIPLTLVIPVILGYFLLLFSEKYAINPGFEITLFVVSMIVFFFFLYWYSSGILNRIDHAKLQDELRIKQLNEELEKKVQERTAELSDYKYAIDASAIIVITDANGIIQHVNDNYTRISGFEKDEVLGKGHSLVNPAIHPVAVIDDLWNTLARGKVWRGELRHFNRNGEPYWEETTIVPFLDENHKPFQYLHINTDITEKKKASEEIILLNEHLLQKEKKLNGLIENSNELISIVDEQFSIIYRSPNYERITGYKREDSQLDIAMAMIHPDDLPDMRDLASTLIQNPGVSIPLNLRMRHKDGYFMWMEGTAQNFLQDEAIKGMVFNIRDISERKAAEERIMRSEKIYRTIAANIPKTTIIIFSETRHYLLIEGNFAHQLGYHRENMIGKYYGDVLEGVHYTRVKTDLDRVFNDEKFSREIGFGRDHFVASYVPLKDEAGHIYAAMTVISDVTEIATAQKEVADVNAALEKRVEERTQQLEQINKELEAFTYSVSHDLRSPIRIIDGFADFLGQDYGEKFDESAKRKLFAIQRNAKKMNGLIDDLLKLSGIGKKTIRLEHTDMNILIKTVLEDYPDHIQQLVKIDLNGLNFIICDTNLIQQVWQNLISNAIKYTSKKDAPEIIIGAEEKEGKIIYSIQDNGAGFDPAYAGKLFTVFQRLHNASEFEGTGIGLALVQRIISRHSGQVWADGQIDQGATFYFTLNQPIHQ